MKKITTFAKKTVRNTAIVGATVLASAGALAEDHSVAIAAAGADGTANTIAAATVVIAIAAVVTGITLVIRLITK
jgi:hypothetical protein